MRWIRQYTLFTYVKQRYHRRSVGVVVMVFVFSYILAGLSPADNDKVFVELSLAVLEILFALGSVVIAVAMANKKSESTIHIIHSQGLSYQQIFLAHRSIGLTVLLYLCIIGYLGLLFAVMVDTVVLGIAISILYLWLKVSLLYTIIFVLAHHISTIIAAIFGLVLYILFYSVGLIQLRSDGLSQSAQGVVTGLLYVLPQFVSIGQNIVHINWLLANIFTIVISYGIYIICLLVLGAHSYTRIRWK